MTSYGDYSYTPSPSSISPIAKSLSDESIPSEKSEDFSIDEKVNHVTIQILDPEKKITKSSTSQKVADVNIQYESPASLSRPKVNFFRRITNSLRLTKKEKTDTSAVSISLKNSPQQIVDNFAAANMSLFSQISSLQDVESKSTEIHQNYNDITQFAYNLLATSKNSKELKKNCDKIVDMIKIALNSDPKDYNTAITLLRCLSGGLTIRMSDYAESQLSRIDKNFKSIFEVEKQINLQMQEDINNHVPFIPHLASFSTGVKALREREHSDVELSNKFLAVKQNNPGTAPLKTIKLHNQPVPPEGGVDFSPLRKKMKELENKT